jgi:hypothetical protein
MLHCTLPTGIYEYVEDYCCKCYYHRVGYKQVTALLAIAWQAKEAHCQNILLAWNCASGTRSELFKKTCEDWIEDYFVALKMQTKLDRHW